MLFNWFLLLDLIPLADSQNVIDELDPNTIYIVGGIVDKNRHKGLCLEEAVKYQISHARLPIQEHIDMSTRKVLTINQGFDSQALILVVSILAEFVNSRDWKETFLKTIPSRKGVAALASPEILSETPSEIPSKEKESLKEETQPAQSWTSNCLLQ